MEFIKSIGDFITEPITSHHVYKRVRHEWGDPELSALLGTALGMFWGVGVGIAMYTGWTWWGLFMVQLSTFHILEYFITAFFNHSTLTYDSYLLNHSDEYHIAMITVAVEYFCESLFAPSLKTHSWISYLGLFLAVMGQFIRTIAMCTAGLNFTHLVREKRVENHQLVTSGIYRYCRHPSYMGWFYWSVGTQIMLCNPVTTVCFAFVSYRFFSSRIFYEEIGLVSFFGKDYEIYRDNVPTLIPGIA